MYCRTPASRWPLERVLFRADDREPTLRLPETTTCVRLRKSGRGLNRQQRSSGIGGLPIPRPARWRPRALHASRAHALPLEAE